MSYRPIKIAASPAIVLLCALAIIFTLDVAQGLLAPIASAIVLGVVCAPLSEALEKIGLPRAVAAFLVLFLFITATVFIFVALEPTLSYAISNAPIIWFELRTIVEALQGALSGVREFQASVESALGDAAATEEGAAADMPIPSVFDALAYGPSVVSGLLVFVGTFYFFLSTRRDVYRRIERIWPRLRADLLLIAEARVSRYFLAVTMVNAGFGTAVTFAMTVIGMPQPLMWGLATFLLNFLLYLGPAMVAFALLIVGVTVFDGFWSVVPMGSFVLMNLVEAQFVTPTVVGRQVSMNPLLVFLSLVFWLYLWGPLGGLVAIPIVVWLLFIAHKLHEAPVEAPGSQGAAPQAAE
ncbi:hypothetical protein A8B78_08855 [Jannaschia sp. EhC01]|nr:hypothetical protein A8B78_08855 [Jannaschia sp. EhC01]